MAEDNEYTLVVNKKRVAVSKEVYKAYYQQKEHEAYLDKLSQKHNISFEECAEKGIQIDFILSHAQESIDDKLIKAEMLTKLADAMEKLSGQERLQIYALFFNRISEKQFAQSMGVTKQAVNKQKYRILKKLKKLLEI